MNNAINLSLPNGNKLTLSAALDSRIAETKGYGLVIAKNQKAAYELTNELRAWGCTSVSVVTKREAKALEL